MRTLAPDTVRILDGNGARLVPSSAREALRLCQAERLRRRGGLAKAQGAFMLLIERDADGADADGAGVVEGEGDDEVDLARARLLVLELHRALDALARLQPDQVAQVEVRVAAVPDPPIVFAPNTS